MPATIDVAQWTRYAVFTVDAGRALCARCGEVLPDDCQVVSGVIGTHHAPVGRIVVWGCRHHTPEEMDEAVARELRGVVVRPEGLAPS